MLSEFSQGTGSTFEEAEKTANSWEGRLNSLQNSLDSFVNKLTNKEMVMGSVSFFDRLIQGAEALTDAIGEIPVMLTAVNSAMVATNKNYGITQVWNKNKGKIDVQGNIFGIDFTAIKNMKNHFSEAEEVIAKWNKELKAGKADLDTFENSLVQNSVQLKEYLTTCSKDAPASIEGYRSYLKAAGVNTDTLRWKTVLLNSAITMLGGWAIQAVITGFSELSQVSSKIAESAQELGKSFKETSTTIEDYKAQIEELYSTINDSGSSIEDVTNARKSLLSVQDELIDKFGMEESVINNVTDAINGQTEALDKLTKAKWQETKNDFNHGGFWNDTANFFQNTDNIERMLNDYGEKTISFKWTDYADINKLTDEMVAELENIGIDITVSTDNLQAVRDFDSLTESIEDAKGASISLSGNAEEIYNKLLALQNLIGNDDSFDKLYDKVANTADSYKELTEKYKNFYDQYILQEKIFANDSKYADTFKDITDSAEKYNEAFASGNKERTKEAADEYASLVSTAMSTAIANGDSDVATYFENMYPTLKPIVDSWNFNIAFDANTDDLQNKVQAVIAELKDENGRSLTAEEILELGESNAQYQALVSIAHNYNMTLEEMIELLKERNLVSAMDYQGLVGLFGQENVNKLLPEDLEIAYTIKNVGNMTFEELQAEIKKTKEIANENSVSTTISENISDLKDLNNELDKLGSAIANIDENGKFELSDLDSIADYFLGLEDIPYNIEAVNDSLKVLGSEDSTLEEQTDAINTLADQYLKTSGILDDLTTENEELIKLQLQRMGITNAEEIVEATLNGTLQSQAEIESILAQHKSIVTGETLTLTNVTAEEIQKLIAEGKITNETANQMAILAIKKQLVNGNTLNTSADINNLISLCQMLGATTTALERYNQVKNGANGMPSNVVDGYKKAAEKELQDAIKTGQASLNATYTSVPKAIYNGGANVSKALDDANKSAQSSAKETKDTYEELFDFFERRIDVLNNALELLNANLENVIGSNGKNQLIDAQIGINKESINNYTDALAMYQSKASEALSKIPADFQDKIVNGAVALTDFIGSGNEDLVKSIKEYQEWADKVSDCQQELAKLKETIRQLELDKFNNIIEDFTNQFDISSNAQDLINKQIDLFKEAGELIGKGFYEGLIKESEGQLSILQQEKTKLVEQLNSAIDSGRVNCCPAT